MLPRIILASKSPRRQKLLQWAEVPYDVLISEVAETFPAGLTPKEAAIHIAKNKAEAVLSLNTRGLPILAADTMVVCEGAILGKPSNIVQAIHMLTMLSGKVHEVITGVCLMHEGKQILFSDSTLVKFNELLPSQIAFYVHQYKPLDKAGAYGIQEWIGVTGIKGIEGDYYNVMGLPVNRVVQELKSLKIKSAT